MALKKGDLSGAFRRAVFMGLTTVTLLTAGTSVLRAAEGKNNTAGTPQSLQEERQPWQTDQYVRKAQDMYDIYVGQQKLILARAGVNADRIDEYARQRNNRDGWFQPGGRNGDFILLTPGAILNQIAANKEEKVRKLEVSAGAECDLARLKQDYHDRMDRLDWQFKGDYERDQENARRHIEQDKSKADKLEIARLQQQLQEERHHNQEAEKQTTKHQVKAKTRSHQTIKYNPWSKGHNKGK